MQTLTGGAFDPGLGDQMDLQRAGRVSAEAAAALPTRGRLLMDPERFIVCVQDAPVALDLGAIGKGFALDRMAEELTTWDAPRALVIAGGSSILALDEPEDSTGWEVSVAPSQVLRLQRCAIGTSGTAVKGAHILDPRTGRPTPGPYRAWAVHRSAAVADALSTAWMLLGPEEIEQISRKLPGTRAFVQHLPSDLPEIGEQTF